MPGGRHGQWPAPNHPIGGHNSTDSSPSNATPPYIDATYSNGGANYRGMNHNRYASAGQPGYPPHLPPASGPMPSRNLHSAPHMGSPYGSGPPSAHQQNGGAMHSSHMEPSVFGDPRSQGQGGNAGNSFYPNYGHPPQGMPSSSSYPDSPYGYGAGPSSAPGHNAPPQQPSHSHQSYGASPWMNNSPSSSSFPNPNESGRYVAGKPSYGPSPTASQQQSQPPPLQPAQASYKQTSSYMPSGGSMEGMMYPGHMNQQDGSGDIKAEVEDDEIDGDDVIEEGEGGTISKKGKSQSQKGTSEFVKKLFRMLDDTSYASIVSWGPMGESFIVKDMNDFTKHVLPRHFRHSNFASFVRQLNKYDFHKVKKPDESGQTTHLGVDQMWEFRHPAFVQGREDLLDNVKRKVPTGKKIGGKKDGDDSPREMSPGMPGLSEAADKGAEDYAKLKEQVATLTASQDQMSNHINNLTKQYQGVIGEMLTFQKNMVQQDQLMQNLIQYLMNLEADRKIESGSNYATTPNRLGSTPNRPQLDNGDAFVSSRDAERLVTNFSDVAKESFSQMSQIADRAARQGGNGSMHGSASTAISSTPTGLTYGDSRSSVTTNQAPLSPKSVASHDTPQDSSYMHGGDKSIPKSTLMPDGHIPSVFFHPPHHDLGSESSTTPSSSGPVHKELFNAAANAVNNPSLAGFEGAGLRVFTVGTLQPRSGSDAPGFEPDGSTPATAAMEKAFLRSSGSSESESDNKPYGISVPNLESLPANMPRVDGRTTSMLNTPRSGANDDSQDDTGTPPESGSNMLRVRRSTYVPGWAVPPKVLVVDDDDVCRKLGSKFLQVFGCAIDVAVDGVTAVNKMNLEKYDLVLMDIVMPNLDGVSATSLIREFDPRTPIISMTSNSAPNELLSYMSSGMNDVLPKPFTKEGLLNMLEKHLIHLKTVQKMDEIPKSLGLPPVTDHMLQSVLSATAASAASMSGASTGIDGVANPMAAMMGNGPLAMRTSQEAADANGNGNGAGGGGDFGTDEEGIINPLAGMGFSDEEYISMLQNLIAAGAVSDSTRGGDNVDTVAGVMGVSRGEGGNEMKSKEATPISSNIGQKRSAGIEANEKATDGKRQRFTELQV